MGTHSLHTKRQLDRARLDTVQLVPPTPFTADGRQVVPELLAELTSSLAASGIRVLLPAAGTGEFHSLSPEEVLLCVRTTRQAVPADTVVVSPIGFSVEQAVWMGKGALDAGADSLLLMPPIHPYLSDSGFHDYVVAIAQQLGASLLVYKRGPVPSDHLLAELGLAGHVLGVKYAVNDLDAFARFVSRTRGEVGLYCGTAERWAPYFMLAGATGYTSGTGSVAPRLTLALHRALASGDNVAAQPFLAALRPLEDYRARDADSFNITAIKYAVSCLGQDFGPCRPPQRRLTEGEQVDIQRIVAALLSEERKLA